MKNRRLFNAHRVGERLLLVTSQFPYGRGEAFLAPEAQTLATLVEHIVLAAVHPKTKRSVRDIGLRSFALHTWSGWMARDAFRIVRSRPRDVLAVARAMFGARYRLTAKLKNVLVFGKGLALAEYARRENITHIHAHWLTTPSTVAFVAARLARIPWSVTAHNFDLYADNWITEKIAAAGAVRVISERGAQELRRRLPVDLASRVRVIHLGVRPPVRCSLPAPAGPLRIAAVGFLVPMKGHHVLIDAIAQARDAGLPMQCAIAGDGPLRAELQAQIDKLNLQHIVTLRGFVPHDRIIGEFAAGMIDVVVHPSIEQGNLHEGIPVGLMEAMACGIPCVTTNTGSIPELVDDSCGVVVEQRDAAAVARALGLLAADAPLRLRLGSAARQRVLAEFDAHRTAAGLLELIVSSEGDGPPPASRAKPNSTELRR